MVPKSFGISSRVYRRLHSLEFVRTLGVTAGAARDVAFQIEANFSELLDWCRSFDPDSQTSSSQQAPTTTPTKPIISSSAWHPEGLVDALMVVVKLAVVGRPASCWLLFLPRPSRLHLRRFRRTLPSPCYECLFFSLRDSRDTSTWARRSPSRSSNSAPCSHTQYSDPRSTQSSLSSFLTLSRTFPQFQASHCAI